MTGLGKVIRTTAFKLSAIYIGLFSAFAVAFVLYISYSVNALLEDQVKSAIASEIRGLVDQARTGGLASMFRVIQDRSNEPDAGVYLITDVNGRILTGNISQVPADVFIKPGVGPITVSYERKIGEGSRHLAMIEALRLPGGFWMLVGRDLTEQQQFQKVITRAMVWIVALMIGLALISWFFVTRRVLKRINSVADTSRRIMEGDLSDRLEVTGSGDEFDRLAESLNAMLERIEDLLYGLKDVSDNIAHDLKTPLTRLRSRVERVLAGPEDVEVYREALQATIEESDHLIQIFNALLLIARIEAGSPNGAMDKVDVAAIARDVSELYEPVGEEQGIAITVDAPEAAEVVANRELVGQVLSNLIDNALKYAFPDDRDWTDRAKSIALKVTTEPDAVCLSVADNGVGVPEADRDRVLERFVRLERSRSKSGSGLGLSLVAAVARLHDGELVLGDNRPGLILTIRLRSRKTELTAGP